MTSSGKIAHIPAAVFFLLLLLPFSVQAQPFGMMSAKGRPGPQNTILSAPNGRFVFGQVSDSSSDLFMLDTRTGRLWRLSERGDLGMFLSRVPYCTTDGKCADVPQDPTRSRNR
ncbi:MAG: hypothetical protein DRH37_10660 [Deltaproteobacteria bacterium]|nr:MAG: hypothetical protein DRH37_10660 [Deltaproteobacteria bacterium]